MSLGRRRGGILAGTLISTALLPGVIGGGAFGASVNSASFSGGANIAVVGACSTRSIGAPLRTT
jgi:hypothetical protein